ncbi:MAG: hypothetical protein R6V83_08225 [Candidatus Thorarchaeota archaeon]
MTPKKKKFAFPVPTYFLAKYIVIVRNPFSHVTPLAKQDIVLENLRHENPLLRDWTKIIGHRDLGKFVST